MESEFAGLKRRVSQKYKSQKPVKIKYKKNRRLTIKTIKKLNNKN